MWKRGQSTSNLLKYSNWRTKSFIRNSSNSTRNSTFDFLTWSYLILVQLLVSLSADDKARRTIVDPAVHKECSDDSLKTLIELCVGCLSNELSERPSVEDLIWNLQFAAQVQASQHHSNTESPIQDIWIKFTVFYYLSCVLQVETRLTLFAVLEDKRLLYSTNLHPSWIFIICSHLSIFDIVRWEPNMNIVRLLSGLPIYIL